MSSLSEGGPRNLSEFDSDDADDAELTEDGTPLAPAGRGVTERIVAGLRALGLECSSPEQHSHYGWEFTCGSYWCVVQGLDRWLLVCEDKTWLIWRVVLRRQSAENFQRFLTTIDQVLQADQRVCGVKWFTRDEYTASTSPAERAPREPNGPKK